MKKLKWTTLLMTDMGKWATLLKTSQKSEHCISCWRPPKKKHDLTFYYCVVTRMLSPSSFIHNSSSHQVGFTSAFCSNRSSLLGFRAYRNFNSISLPSCSMNNQQNVRIMTCCASTENDVSHRLENIFMCTVSWSQGF